MADCLTKIPIKLKEPVLQENGLYLTQINVPCGKCARCIERRKMEWSFRMETEMERSKTAYFVTLTYNPEHIPYTEKGKYTLQPKHLEKFWKRLRQNQIRSKTTIEHLYNNLKHTDKIKYYAAGEYGEDRGRPHYHAIIFNASMTIIEKSWLDEYGHPIGYVHIVKANHQTINYLMKYLDKWLNKKQSKYREPEYNTMSEGIGEDYIKKNMAWHKRNLDVLYVTNKLGIKIPMPKYYRLQIFDEEERKKQLELVKDSLDLIKQERIELIGEAEYYQELLDLKKSTAKRFKKKTRKRNQD